MNSFGKIYRLTSFGESHGVAMGGVVDGVPSGVKLDFDEIQREVDRRRPGQSDITTPRDEKDKVEFLSGIEDGYTLGSPIGFVIRNENIRPDDYSDVAKVLRPGHADFTYLKKYGRLAKSGGGRASARETVSRTVAGAVAKQILAKVSSLVVSSSILEVKGEKDPSKFDDIILSAQKSGDSVGGVVECKVKGVPVGLGEPVFDRLEADLAKAMLSLPATKGFEIGDGFASTYLFGSENNDEMRVVDGKVKFLSNHAGGVLGGISNGDDIVFRVAFKPVSSISKSQKSVTAVVENPENAMIEVKGRHDPCVLLRALPIVEAMTAHVLLDHFLRFKSFDLWKN